MRRTEASQYEAWRTRDGVTVLIVDSDLLSDTLTRVVVPLLSNYDGTRLRYLKPDMLVDRELYVLDPTQIGAVLVTELTERLGTLAHERDRITRAIDTLLSGV